jgi:very-short-patch-repair endonuclease
VDGYKFRRQQPLGVYIVDFACLQRRLVIELDGGQHAQEANYDAARDAWLREQGFTILRFWNNDVLKNIDGVMEMIVTSLKGAPYLNPSPQGGRKKTRAVKTQAQDRS